MKNLPEEFCQRILQTHADGQQLLDAIEVEPNLSVRLHPIKSVDPHLLPFADAVPWNPASGRYLSQRPLFTLIPQLHAGAFYVQEASSMMLAHAVRSVRHLLPPSPVCLDLCAAPGGKSTLLLSEFADDGVVVANEVVRSRAWILRENVAKWGLPNAVVVNRLPAEIAASGASFDLIAVDAPCSGEGMFRKDDVAVAEWNVKAAADCATRQRSILQDIWCSLRPGGFLVYSTCTFNPAENEDNMQWLVSQFGAQVVPLAMQDSWNVSVRCFDGGQGYAFYPHKVRGEGFFICLLRKPSDAPELDAPRPDKKKKSAKQPAVKPSALGRQSLAPGYKVFISGDSDLWAAPADRADVMASLAERLSPLLCGVPVGSVLVKKGAPVISPAPELAFSVALSPLAFPRIDVDRADALKFLHGDTDIALPQGAEGWWLVVFESLPLGFVKCMQGRMNNYYPKEWRIKMDVADK